MKRGLTSIFLLPFTAMAAATNNRPTLVPAYGELPPTFWEQHQADMVVASFAAIALVFLFLKVMLRPETKVVLPPETVARQALAQLQGRLEDGKLLSEVSQILRRYLVAAFQWPPAEMTTSEFYKALAQDEKIGLELGGAVSGFLRECDERKFSSAPPVSSFNALGRARELVARAEIRLDLVGRASSRAGTESQ